MTEIFIALSLTILIAVVVSAIMRLLKQPLIIGYIVTGILVGPYFFNLITQTPTMEIFSKIGVALLLFTVGLHLNPKIIKEVGKISLITGIGQVIFTSVFGFLIARLIGFEIITSFYIAVALTFSSTIIIMKLLSDKGDLDKVYGKISVGFLIVQDLIVVIVLIVITTMSSGENLMATLSLTLLKGFLAIAALFFFGLYVLPKVVKRVAKSQEFLFLFSIGWCLVFASAFFLLDFSIEVGALLAGITLSLTPYSNEIGSKMKPLRDFFIVIFFIIIGSQMVISDIAQNWVPILVFSLFILIGNPIIVMTLMGLMGYKKRNGFQAGLTVAQISEFSIILIALGVSVGHLSAEVLSLVTTIGLITIAGSTYMIMYSHKLYPLLAPYLKIFEKKKTKKDSNMEKNYEAVLFGYNRIGFSILHSLKNIRKNYLVVDFDPNIVSILNKTGIPCIYGDVYDSEFLEELPLNKLQLVISTIPEFESNELLLDFMKRKNPDAVVVLRADEIGNALKLYELGADYVLTPHFLGGEHVSKLIKRHDVIKENYTKEKDKHMNMIKKIMNRGR